MTLKRPPKETPPLYAQDGKGYEAIVHAHYFVGSSDWLVTEYSPADDEAFGWACVGGDRQNAELGYTDIGALEEFTGRQRLVDKHGDLIGVLPVHVEFDEGWQPCTLREAIARLDARQGR